MNDCVPGFETKQSVRMVSITQGLVGTPAMTVQTAEEAIVYAARVSNPANQMSNETAPRLISYLIKNKHWSPFEMASMTIEIVTSRAIAAQILRHRSFSFQEFSQRYATAFQYIPYRARRQDTKNRQNSIDDMSFETQEWFKKAQQGAWERSFEDYQIALSLGIAKECARMLLPLNTATKLYMSGTVRSWIHYLQVRDEEGVQQEHRDIARGIKQIFCAELPSIAEALEWNK